MLGDFIKGGAVAMPEYSRVVAKNNEIIEKFDEKIIDNPKYSRIFQYFLVKAIFSKEFFEKHIYDYANKLKKLKLESKLESLKLKLLG